MKHDQLLDWQRKLDPSNFNKTRGAQYHTAPSVVFPGSPDYPEDAPDNSVTIMFQVDAENWLSQEEKLIVDSPFFIEKPPKTKSAKHGPIMVLTADAALGAVVYNDNYYWAAWTLTQYPVWRAIFKRSKPNSKGKVKILITATFLPEN